MVIEHQYKLRGFYYDYAVIGARLLIEVDGDYWHALPKQQHRDKVKTAIARSLGWRLVRLTEAELSRDWNAAINRVVWEAQ